MLETARSLDLEQTRIMLGLLDSVEKDGNQTQRRIASDLGIALGLANAYLRRCISKGLVKASQAPARRYVYYLTPKGFAEKSRLTVEFLSCSFDFFRKAKADCARLFEQARSAGFTNLALAGKSDLAEIAAICAFESGVNIVAVVDPRAGKDRFMNYPLVRTFDDMSEALHGVVITDLSAPRSTCQRAVAFFGADRVLIPSLLRLRLTDRLGAADDFVSQAYCTSSRPWSVNSNSRDRRGSRKPEGITRQT